MGRAEDRGRVNSVQGTPSARCLGDTSSSPVEGCKAQRVGGEQRSVRGCTARCQVGRGLKKDCRMWQVGGWSWAALARAFSGVNVGWKAGSGGLRVEEDKGTEGQVQVQGASWVLLSPHPQAASPCSKRTVMPFELPLE